MYLQRLAQHDHFVCVCNCNCNFTCILQAYAYAFSLSFRFRGRHAFTFNNNVSQNRCIWLASRAHTQLRIDIPFRRHRCSCDQQTNVQLCTHCVHFRSAVHLWTIALERWKGVGWMRETKSSWQNYFINSLIHCDHLLLSLISNCSNSFERNKKRQHTLC